MPNKPYQTIHLLNKSKFIRLDLKFRIYSQKTNVDVNKWLWGLQGIKTRKLTEFLEKINESIRSGVGRFYSRKAIWGPLKYSSISKGSRIQCNTRSFADTTAQKENPTKIVLLFFNSFVGLISLTFEKAYFFFFRWLSLN